MKLRYYVSVVGAVCMALGSCTSSSDGGQTAADGDGGAICGQAGASECHDITWPRLVVLFGDATAATWTYTVLEDGTSYPPYMCPVTEESPDFHCDVGFGGYPGLTEVTVQVAGADGGPMLASEVVQLHPFNRCGDEIVEVIVSSSDAGEPAFSAPTIENACAP